MSERKLDINDILPPSMPDMAGEIIAETLAPQLGTDTIDLAKGRFDMRRLSVIDDNKIRPLLYGMMRARKSRVWGNLIGNFLNVRISLNGRGRRDIIRMEAVSKGGGANVDAEINKPNWAARNLYQRDWEKQEKDRLGIDE